MRIAVVSLKGGVGKSTLAVSLACCLADDGHTVLVDGDPSRTALLWHRRGTGLPCAVVPVDEAPGATAGARHVVVDTAAHLSARERQGLLSRADLAVIPTPPSLLSLDTVARLVQSLQGVPYLVVITLAPPPPSRDGEEAISALYRAGIPTCATPVRRYIAYERAAQAGVPVYAVADPRAGAAWRDIEAVTQECRRYGKEKRDQ